MPETKNGKKVATKAKKLPEDVDKAAHEEIKLMAEQLRHRQQERIVISKRVAGDDAFVALGENLTYCKGLVELNIWDCKLSLTPLKTICKSLVKCPKMIQLFLDSNGFGPGGGFLFVDLLPALEHLRDLGLANNELDDGFPISCQTMLQNHPTLETIDLTGNNITDNGCKALTRTLTKLKQLRLRNNKFTFVGALGLVRSAFAANKLRVLDLESDTLTAKHKAKLRAEREEEEGHFVMYV
jgi:Ran GTPase-activating protein (RanGAP) involved in mRNA processing and transport